MMDSALELIEQSFHDQYSNWVYEALGELPDNFTITDPYLSGHPIVFASRGFLDLCGYSREEVIGKNGRMFQGPGTSRRSVMEIREAIREERTLQISLLNYHKDGSPYWVLFHLNPIFSKDDGRLIHFVAVQVPILRRSWRWQTVAATDGREFSTKNSHQSRELLVGACRREISLPDYAADSACSLSYKSMPDPRKAGKTEDLCDTTELEKQKASSAVNNILSVLSHYSELTGKAVTGQKCNNVQGPKVLSSALIISLGRIQQSFVLIDPYLPNLPIVHASDSFLNVTGYSRHEVIGKSHNIVCGVETDPSTVSQMTDCIQNGMSCRVRILYYRKDKRPYWNLVHLSPVRNASGKIAYFVEVQMVEEEEHCSASGSNSLSPDQRLVGAIGAVKVAIRSQSIGPTASCQRA